jgi:hypothetical protein
MRIAQDQFKNEDLKESDHRTRSLGTTTTSSPSSSTKVLLPRTSRDGERVETRETTMSRITRNMNATSSVSQGSHRHFEWYRQTNGRQVLREYPT